MDRQRTRLREQLHVAWNREQELNRNNSLLERENALLKRCLAVFEMFVKKMKQQSDEKQGT
jgi:transposase-like protein